MPNTLSAPPLTAARLGAADFALAHHAFQLPFASRNGEWAPAPASPDVPADTWELPILLRDDDCAVRASFSVTFAPDTATVLFSDESI